MYELLLGPIDDIASPRWYWRLKMLDAEGTISEGEAESVLSAQDAGALAIKRHNWTMKEVGGRRFVWNNGAWELEGA